MERSPTTGDSGGRKALLRRWSVEFPDDSGVLMKLANAAADDADYESAYRFLQRAVSARHELEQDPESDVVEPHRDVPKHLFRSPFNDLALGSSDDQSDSRFSGGRDQSRLDGHGG
jgi:hypothetical protein